MDKHWLDEPKNVERLRRAALALLALLVVVELGVSLHPHFAVDAIFGFHAWYGLLACAALIAVAKALGLLLKRPDDYYERGHD